MSGNMLTVHVVIILIPMTVVTSRGNNIVNLARQKSARQISTKGFPYGNGTAGLAVDGCLDNVFRHGSCSHTKYNPSKKEWWEVDLGNRYRINEIKILNRAQNVKRLHDIAIDVYENEKRPRKRKHCTTHKGPAGPGWLNVSCESAVNGRYVRISKLKSDKMDVLTLCEVEIYGASEEKLRPWLNDKIPKSMAAIQGQEFMAMSFLNCCSICG